MSTTGISGIRQVRIAWPVRIAWLAAMGVALGGCASMLPKLEPPTLVITAVAIGGGNLQQQQIRLTFHATNPNNRAIPIRRIECNLELAGSPFAQGATDAPFTLPALGESDFNLNVTANMNSVLAALAGGFGRHAIDYRVYGQVHLQGGLVRNIPFDQKGSVKL
jgi:LEA14-like dessication related protein